jgi:hypothetical protein
LDLVAIFAKRLKAKVLVTHQPGTSLTLRFKET